MAEVYGMTNGESLEVYASIKVGKEVIEFKSGMAFLGEEEIGVEQGIMKVAQALDVDWADRDDKDATIHFNGGVGLKFESLLGFKMFCLAMLE